MSKFQVSANGQVFGIYDADTEKEARDLCAQDAGYDSEEEMEARLQQSSELIAVEGEMWTTWEDGGEPVEFFLPDGVNPCEEGARVLGVALSEALNVAPS